MAAGGISAGGDPLFSTVMNEPKPSDDQDSNEFERESETRPPPVLLEFWYFLREHKKWWLIPLLLTLAVYALFVIVSVSGGPAFMYTLF